MKIGVVFLDLRFWRITFLRGEIDERGLLVNVIFVRHRGERDSSYVVGSEIAPIDNQTIDFSDKRG